MPQRPIKYLPYFIFILLFFLPFFWIPVGTMDLGGDSSRLYFYDPIGYLKNVSLYFIAPHSIGTIEPSFFFIPYALLIKILLLIFKSGYVVVSIFSGIKLSIAFICIYYIVKNLLKKNNKKTIIEISSILAALLYISMPTMTGNWDKALTSHNQIFINPLMFLLIYKFFDSNNFKYLWGALVVSFLFASSFAVTSAPPFFAFFPIAILFLIILFIILRKKKIDFRLVFWSFILFIGIQSFHLIPQIVNAIEPGSMFNARIFDKDSIQNEGVRYFSSVVTIAKVSRNILLPVDLISNKPLLVLVPITIILSLIFKRKVSKEFLLVCIFFLFTLFLLSANITKAGNNLYMSFFYIPGFSMFRNFIGQWLFVFSFFYSLAFGYSLYYLSVNIRKKFYISLFSIITITLIVSGLNFFNGQLTNKEIITNPHKKIALDMDSKFIDFLQYIKKFDDGKILTLPISDAFYQLLPGKTQGIYIGPSLISNIAGINDFVGYQNLSPFSEQFLKFSREKNYDGINRILSLLNIKYIVVTNTPIYDKSTPDYFSYVRQSLPSTNKDYHNFLSEISASKIFEKSHYEIYKLNKGTLEHIYLPNEAIISNKTAEDTLPLEKYKGSLNSVYINTVDCKRKVINNICKVSKFKNNPTVTFSKLNPIMYKIKIRNAADPFILVFSNSYHKNWKLYIPQNNTNGSYQNLKETFGFIDGQTISDDKHFVANYYANGWIIDKKGKEINLVLVQKNQRLFFYSILVTFMSLIALTVIGLYIFRKNITGIMVEIKNKF